MGDNKFIIEVEKAKESVNGKPSMGPVYRSSFAKDGFPEPVQGLESCWDVFRISVEKYPRNRMLGRREIVDGKPGKYLWQTYKEVYDIVMKVLEAGSQDSNTTGLSTSAPQQDQVTGCILRNMKKKAVALELGPHGAADTHPVAAISNGTGDLASDDTSNVAPGISIPIGRVAPDTSIWFGNSTSTEHGEEELHILPTPTEAPGNISGLIALTGLLLYSGAIISMLFLGYLGVLVLAGGYLAIGLANIVGYSRAMIFMLFILCPCATEAATHIELGPHGAADTHPVALINDVAGDSASGGIGIGALDSSTPIGNIAHDTTITIGDPSDSDGDNTSRVIGTGGSY